ncbi:hypothetical protein H5410_064090 [Solanum commersonii]|uniref:Uncharacterized protein n=1 Tax=Solanum commersonii TaxID=4109 RepID=A0A9J5W083_SOLCO|nr:hypothetical protein H5410_064090 [Solanum commersonii]
MANQSSTKRKSKKEVKASSKAKDAKTQKKKDRKVAPPISQPTLPMLCISFAFNLDINKTDIINWAALNAYKDNKTGELLGPQHSFEVKFARDIMQKESDSLAVLYPPNFTYIFHSIGNAKARYVSENDDPTRLKDVFIPLADEELINVE